MATILQILSTLPSVINAIEQLFGSMPGKGKIKKDVAMKSIQAILDGAGGVGVKVNASQVTELASKFIDGYVAVQNTVGAFHHDLR